MNLTEFTNLRHDENFHVFKYILFAYQMSVVIAMSYKQLDPLQVV